MKKHLLLGSALLAAMSAYPQNGRIPQNHQVENSAARISKRFAMDLAAAESADKNANKQSPASATEVSAEDLKPSNTNSFTTSWNAFTGSMNIYGNIISGSAVLNYNEDLNAVSFVHRKSQYYQVSPTPASNGAATGAMVAMISQNWGATWDSTCFYSNDAQWGRYPQGAIYNPNGGTCIDQAYIVGTGPVTPPSAGWAGNFYASKQLGAANYNSAPSTTPNAQQLLLHANTGINKVDFTRYDFSTTDDGKVRTIGLICNDISATGVNFGYRGARLMTGSFNSGTFVWTPDSIIPQTVVTAGSKEVLSTPHMAWNESGTVGYIFHIGVAATATNNNRGFQPIIFKTVNSGVSWAPVNGIDFNNPNMSPVLDHILSTRVNTNVTVPFFDDNEGISAVVDKNDKLHIVALVKGATSIHPDSLGFTYLFDNADSETYGYAHVPGIRPYLYDFIGDGSPSSTWTVVTIDSLSSEAPSGDPARPNGFADYPWQANPDGGLKPISDARIQTSRTADGNYIVYTFAESDTLVTTGGVKWNQLPNVKARMMNVTTQSVHPVEINITKPISGTNANVASRAYFHHTSRKCAVAQSTPIGPNGPCLVLPITVSRNTTFDPMIPITHRYASAALNFGGVADGDMVLPVKAFCATETLTAISENNLKSANNSFVYPNPTSNTAMLFVNLKNNSAVNVVVSNMVGQVVRTSFAEAVAGENNLDINVNGLAKGIYMVTVKIDQVSSTKKLIID